LINDLDLLDGVVLGGAHGIYDVYTDAGIIRCTLRGKLKKAFARAQSAKSLTKARIRRDKAIDDAAYARHIERMEKRDSDENPLPTRLSVGDHVKVRPFPDRTGLIEEILPRQSELARKDTGSTDKKARRQTLLANLDQVVLVLAMAQPEPHFGFLDRYLAICEAAELYAIICMNKADLPHPPSIEEAMALYSRIGYIVLPTSAQTGQGIDQLRELLKDHTTLFTGPSGVGKSSLVNAIEPGMAIRTGLISETTGKGRHITTSSRLYPLSAGGWLADSAGIRALATWDISPEELAECFVEFRPYLGKCEYVDCTHIDEEGCAILQAVADEAIDMRRYRSYVRMYTGEER
jgi:ribosome biogenesis GTPase